MHEIAKAIEYSQYYCSEAQKEIADLQKYINTIDIVYDPDNLFCKDVIAKVKDKLSDISLDMTMVDIYCREDDRVVDSLNSYVKKKMSYDTWEDYKQYIKKKYFIGEDKDESADKIVKANSYSSYSQKSEAISYALCRHYYDKGIPDEPWCKSPGDNGASITYFPNFSEEHWTRHFWFNFFSDTFYLKMFATWDSIIEIIDEYYQYGIKKDLRFRKNVLKELEKDNPALVEVFENIQKNEMYINANRFRTAAAHGTSASEISNTVQVQRDITVDIPKLVNGIGTTESVKANRIISYSAGSYTNTDTIVKNMEDFTRFSGRQIQEIINLMET